MGMAVGEFRQCHNILIIFVAPLDNDRIFKRVHTISLPAPFLVHCAQLLCLYPVARIKDQPNNRAYHAMREGKLLVDCYLQPEELEKMGIKYSCFDC